jgi:prolyl oligopeptidase PreP (S9A serine peptidase family)
MHRSVVRYAVDPYHRNKRITFKPDVQEKINKLDTRTSNELKIFAINTILERSMMKYQLEPGLRQLTYIKVLGLELDPRYNKPLIKQKVIGTKVLLYYPDFSKPIVFHLYTDASDHQLEAFIMQDKMPTDFNPEKLNTAQKWYTIMERSRELLSAIETCK